MVVMMFTGDGMRLGPGGGARKQKHIHAINIITRPARGDPLRLYAVRCTVYGV